MNWGNILGIAGIVLALPLSVTGAIITPKLQTWYGNRTSSRAEKRIKTLNKQLERVSELHGSTVKLLAFGLRNILQILLNFAIISALLYYLDALNVPSEISSVFLFLYYYAIVLFATINYRRIRNVYSYEKYSAKVTDTIERLQKKITT